MIRFLCVSDIHGHKAALDAVIEEANGRGWDQLVVCGDLCFPGPDPLGVWETLTRHNALCVQGIGDRALARVDPSTLSPSSDEERARAERHAETRRILGELILMRLAKLPTEARLPLQSGHTMLVVHGSPKNPSEAITEDMDDQEMLAMLGDEPGDLVICGASHVPFDRTVADVRIVNVGSVGEAPGGGYAHAVIVEDTQTGVRVTPFDVLLEG